MSIRSPAVRLQHLNVTQKISQFSRHYIHNDQRSRLSAFWAPTAGSAKRTPERESSTELLLRAGYIRQAHSGLYHYLPLAARVHEKLERLIDGHMRTIGASKLSLSSISSEKLWQKSGRLEGSASELFRFKDRRDAAYLLSPTHEEEITTLIAGMVQSYKDLPLRLYQTTRKYRDEPRPRKGLLRTREFTMKDLYTFDYDSRRAMQTYQDVRDAYARFFDSLKIRYIVAEADSGNMGGNLSHEYHLPSSDGEDHVVSCNRCGYAANEELAECRPIGSSPVGAAVSWSLKDTPLASIDLETSIERYQGSEDESDPFHVEISVWSGITRDRSTLVNVFYPSSRTTPHKRSSNMPGYANQVNVHAIKALVPDLDAGVEDPVPLWKRHFRPRIPEPSSSDGIAEAEKYSSVVNLFDCRLPPNFFASTFSNHADFPVSTKVPSFTSKQIPTRSISAYPESDAPLNLLSIKNGDACPRCLDGELKVTRVVEIGHTFHLGSRYSVPLGATVEAQPEPQIERTAQRKREDGSGNMKEQSSSSARFDDGEVKMAKGQVALQMGCHGLGISRIIGAVADSLADEKGLNWPRVMAPFEVVIIAKAAYQDAAIRIYDLLSANNVSPTMPADSNSASKDTQETLTTDVILDDRAKDFVWKMNDADLIGYPVIVVLGNSWSKRGKCEVQCRRLDNLRTEVSEEELRPLVASLLREL